MKYFQRKIEPALKKYLSIFPAIAVTGPRQSGKSTTLKKIFHEEYEYVTFDDPLLVEFFQNDPYGFINKYNNKIIFDEIQKTPGLFNYLKIQIDNDRSNYGKFILTGSSQFSLVGKISESLAGRIGMLSLLPFQYIELPVRARKNQIIKGSYPELVVRNYAGSYEWYSSYIANYLERDVRTLFNIGNLTDFQRLISLLAARVAQELNMSALAGEIGISVKTVKSWISILEASYIVFMLQPYQRNLGKRIVKRPKIYFYDTGIVCYLTGISSHDILEKGPLSGALFENYIVSEVKKNILHRSVDSKLYYFRSNLGLEADLIIEDRLKSKISIVEIKNTSTFRNKMLKNITKIIELEKNIPHIVPFSINGILFYRGTSDVYNEDISLVNFEDFLKTLN